MQINKLSKYSLVNTETIRKYRERGLLQPVRNEENGYYEYSIIDFLNLLNIRKLRGCNLPLDTIEYTYDHGHEDDILRGFHNEIKNLESEIAELQSRLDMLQITMDHFDMFSDTDPTSVQLIDAFDVKYDAYFTDYIDPEIALWINNMVYFTLVICVKKEDIVACPIAEKIPVKLGIGSYETLIKRNNLGIPKRSTRFPKGKYASLYVELENPDYLSGSQLQPLADFVRENQLKITGDSTAYLYRFDNTGKKQKLIYRLRVPVEPE